MPNPGAYLQKLLEVNVTRKLLEVLLHKMRAHLERMDNERSRNSCGKMQNPLIYKEQVDKLLSEAYKIAIKKSDKGFWIT